MSHPSLRWVFALSMWLLLAFSATGQEAKKKPLAVEDLYLMESVRSPTVVYPKGHWLIYERIWIEPSTKTERHSLWYVDDEDKTHEPLVNGRLPVASPDGKWIAFLQEIIPTTTGPGPAVYIPPKRPTAPPYSDAVVEIWLYRCKTRQMVLLGPHDRQWGRVFHDGFYGRVAFSPDGKRLAFVADDGKDPRTKEEIENDVEIVRPDQGEGYSGYGPAQIWIAELDADKGYATKVTRLTDDEFWYGDPQWSPDGKSLVVVANKTKDRESVRFSINKNFDLYLIDVASKKQTQLTTNPGPDVSPRWSPDGKRIAYLSSPRNGPHRDVLDLAIVTPGDGGAKPSIVLDRHADEQKRSLAFPLPDDCWETDRHLRCRVDRGISMLDLLCDVEKKTLDDPAVSKFAKKFQAKNERLKELYPPPAEFWKKRVTSPQNVFSWQNDGFEIQGNLTSPRPEVAKPPYKLIVYPHGGPHGSSTAGFDFTVQLFAAHGYAVFQPNFRGSSGYGKKFLDADRLDLGGGDMRDILTGIDQLVKNGMVDPKRQFVYGTSYGGFMASWLVGHTNQFRAAVAQNAVTDMNMMYGLSDLQSWTTWELGGLPWEQPERYKKHSPLTYADKIKTPTLILHAKDDRRCPLPMGKAFHQALLANEVPTQMVIYPNEGHGIRQPRHREDVYRRVLAWFAKYDVK